MIEVINLSQIYKSKKGVFNLNFEIADGEVFGFLGPNGAGKTTTIRNILGFANATEGNVLINGLDTRIHASELQNIIGYLPGEMMFFENYSGREFLNFIMKMRGLSDMTLRDSLITKFDLEDNIKVRKMSKGMKQKLGIIAAFMHDPQILILDEPTSGLDPLMQNLFLELILDQKKLGKTILMSSHIFEEVERVCDRAGIIRDGKLLDIENVNTLRNKKEDVFIISLNKDNDLILKEDFNVEKLPNSRYKVYVKGEYKDFLLSLSKYNIIKIESARQSIEDIFMKYYSGGEQ